MGGEGGVVVHVFLRTTTRWRKQPELPGLLSMWSGTDASVPGFRAAVSSLKLVWEMAAAAS